MSDYKINILHLYPDLLNLYGDKGNIECLRKRLEWRNIGVEVVNFTAENADIDFSNTDIIFIGGGLDREEDIVLKRLLEKKEQLKAFVEDGGSVVAVCGGYQILGKYRERDGQKQECLDILDIYTNEQADSERMFGDAIIEVDGLRQKVVGFENHSGKTNIGNHTPLGKVIKGYGNDGVSGSEGVVYKNTIGTYLYGPLLPKNPELCDWILEGALKRKYPEFKDLEPIDDGLEILANQYIVERKMA